MWRCAYERASVDRRGRLDRDILGISSQARLQNTHADKAHDRVYRVVAVVFDSGIKTNGVRLSDDGLEIVFHPRGNSGVAVQQERAVRAEFQTATKIRQIACAHSVPNLTREVGR